MSCKILLIAAALGVAAAQHHQAHSGHGHAVSSQNIVVHHTHGHVQQAPATHHESAHHEPTHHQPAEHSKEHHVDHYAPPHYTYDYSVKDSHTGDIKSQHETREGDHTKGFYSFHEADGTIRRVEYTVDKHSGFNAVVHREGHATHSAPAHHQATHH